MPTIEIQAIDTLFFRDGKPFEMGDDNWAEGIFPPPPSVFYGALRSAYFAEHPEQLNLANTENDPTKDLRITGIYLSYDDVILIPTPLDLVFDKNYDDEHLFHLKLIDNSTGLIKSNYPFRFIPFFEGEVESAQNTFIKIGDFRNYYFPNNYEQEIITKHNLNSLLKKEPKIGIGLNNISGSVSEGKLYRIGLSRIIEEYDKDLQEFKMLKFIVSYDNLEIKDSGILKFGAENKTTIYRKYPEKINLFKDDYNEKIEYFKIVTLTPTIFEKNGIPNFEKIFSNIDFELLTAFIGKYSRIGGWDISKKEPKINYKVIPAGSVFYFHLKNEKLSIVELSKKMNNSLSFILQNEGFGLYTLAKLKFKNLIIK